MELDFTDEKELEQILDALFDLYCLRYNNTAGRLKEAIEECKGQTTLHLNI